MNTQTLIPIAAGAGVAYFAGARLPGGRALAFGALAFGAVLVLRGR